MKPLHFTKMHGIGNDFVIVDCRSAPLPLDPAAIRAMADRHTGVGFDQLLAIEPPRSPGAAFGYLIWNRDGSAAGQCGNGLRCVARWLAREGAIADSAVLDGPAGPVQVELRADGSIRADMGEPAFAPARVPLAVAHEADQYRLVLPAGEVAFGAVSMGNPHAVVEVAGVTMAAVASIGSAIEHAALFPAGANVGFAERVAEDHLRLRVWERGVGETRACGSGACAAMAVLRRRGRVGARVAVDLPGGRLVIEWAGPGHRLRMTGPAAFVFEGEYFPPDAT